MAQQRETAQTTTDCLVLQSIKGGQTAKLSDVCSTCRLTKRHVGSMTECRNVAAAVPVLED